MPSRSRIPVVIAEFGNYLTTSDTYLQIVADPGPPPVTNGERLGLDIADVAQWHTYRQQWDPLYATYNNPNTRTKTVTSQVENLMTAFREFAQPMLNIMAASPEANEYDEQALNFKIDRKPPTRPTVPIEESCLISSKSLGGGQMKFICRTAEDTARASLPETANSVLISYRIGEQAPQNPDDGTKTIIATRASTVQALGAEHSGKRVHYYARWYHTNYPTLAGPWSSLKTETLT